MDENQRKEERRKLKELRQELEEKIKGIIPDALKAQMIQEIPDDTFEENVVIDEKLGKQIVEALMFAASKPITVSEMHRIVKVLKPLRITQLIEQLKEDYIREDRSFRVNEVAEGYEISTMPQFGTWIAKLEKEKKAKHSSLAALETLSILAYKQPVTRVEIEEIRGVDVSGVIATLLDRGFVHIVGRKEMPGRPLLYGTTQRFLEHFGLKSLKELPSMDEIKTLVDDTIKREELLRGENVVENVARGEQHSGEENLDLEQQTVELAQKYEDISQQIDDVKVMSARKIKTIIDPQQESSPEQLAEEKAENTTEKQKEHSEPEKGKN